MSICAIDADSLIYKGCGIAEKVVYDILPLDVYHEGMEYDEYKTKIISTFRYVKDYTAWLKEHKKSKEDFTRVSRVELQPLAYALQIIGNSLRDIIDKVGAEQNMVFISGDTNFRNEIAVMRGYKESRRLRDKPQYFYPSREYLLKSWNAIMIEGEEADDGVAQMATSCELDDQMCCIATIDKDLMTVPGWKYNYDKHEFHFVTIKEARMKFYTQLLTGDKGDDIVGVPGIGPAGASQLLKPNMTEYEMFQVVLAEYEKAFQVKETQHNKKLLGKIGEKVLRENAQLLHMRRYRGEVWTPPTIERI